MTDRTIHVACTFDRAFLPHCAAMVHSLLATQRDGVEVHVLADDDITGDLLAPLAEMVERLGGRLSTPEPPPPERVAPLSELVPRVQWYRLGLAESLPQLDRVVFLDCDLIVTGSLRKLWTVRLRGNLVAAVTNVFPSPEWAQRHCEAVGLERPSEYFNGGVMVCDLAGWRRQRVGERVREFALANADREPGPEFRGLDERAFLEFMGSHPELLLFPEQDSLNAVLASNRRPLHPRWNTTTQLHWFADGGVLDPGEAQEALAEPAIRHFEGPGVSKPWHPASEVHGRELYWRHRSETPWP